MEHTMIIYQNSQASIPELPPEIYLSIFDHVAPPLSTPTDIHDILSNLCLVCRGFRLMLQPRIFETLEFTNKKTNKLIPIKGPQAFCVALTNGVASATSLAKYVNECTLRDWTMNGILYAGSGAPSCLWDVYRRTLSLLPNLMWLNMSEMCLDASMLQSICSLKRMETLLLKNCVVAREIEPEVVLNFRPPPNLQHFYYRGKILQTEPLHLSTLHQIIDLTYLKTFHSVSWDVTVAIFSNFVGRSSLRELNLSRAVHNYFLVKILTHCPFLKSLTIEGMVPAALPPAPLPFLCIPDLETLICPPSILSDLIPGRPIRKLIISGVSCHPPRTGDPEMGTSRGTQFLSLSGPTTMEVLAQSSASMVILRAPLQIFIPGASSRYFSSLEQLHLDFYHENYDFQPVNLNCKKEFGTTICEMSQGIPPLPCLRTLIISFGIRAPAFWPFLVDLVLQHDLITPHLETLFPNMTTVIFAPLVQWRREVNKPRGGVHNGLGNGEREEARLWSAEILPGHRMVLAALSAAGCLKDAQDYGNALRAAMGAVPTIPEEGFV